MPRKKRDAADKHVRAIREALLNHYVPRHPKAQIAVKRYNSVSVRVRVIDPDFVKKDMIDRDEAVWDALEADLPEETRAEISLLILLTPKESKTSIMNVEFEDPMPSVFG